MWGCGFANQLPAEIFLFLSILACPILGASGARCAPNGELIFFGFPAALRVQQPLESPASPELTQEKCRVGRALSSHSSQCCHVLSHPGGWCSEHLEGALSGASMALGVPRAEVGAASRAHTHAGGSPGIWGSLWSLFSLQH